MIAHVLGVLHYGTSEYIFQTKCCITMSFENPAYKTTKMNTEGKYVGFLRGIWKVNYKMHIIIDSNMPCSCHTYLLASPQFMTAISSKHNVLRTWSNNI